MSDSVILPMDCNGCDPDEMYHLAGCPLAGELRGKLWLRGLEGARFTEISAAVSHPLTVRPANGRELLRVTPDGTVVIADDLTLDEAKWAMTQMAQIWMRSRP